MSAPANAPQPVQPAGDTPKPVSDVVFYVLSTSDDASRDRFTAKLIKKIVAENRQADVLFAQEQDMKRFDLALWQAQPHAFIPHAIDHEVRAPIQLFTQTVNAPSLDVLLNLHTEFQSQFGDYRRTIEVLDQTQALIQKGRERFKQYRTQGIVPTVHKIG